MNAQQLRNSILQQAIQGKLVPQDPNDEPASVLLQRIRKEKERLVKEGKLKKKDLESKPIEEDEIPFEIPKGWEWCIIGDLYAHNNGKQLNKGNARGKMMDYITTSNLYWEGFVLDKLKQMPFEDNEIDRCQAIKGDLLVCEGGDIGRAAIWNYDYPIMLQNHLHKLRSYVPLCTEFFRFLFYYYNKSGMIGGKGIGIQGFSSKALHNTLAPLPPLAEQRRIVAKIEELMPLVERYGKAQQALDQLNESLPARLRQSILQEAIQGRLVPQDPKEELASELLKRIRKEKEQLVKEGKLKKKDLESKPIEEDEIPFEIPESWEWVRLGYMMQMVSGTSYKKNDIRNEGIRVLRGGNIQNNELVIKDDDVFLSDEYKAIDKNIQKDDIIIVASTGSKAVIGKPAFIKETYSNTQIGAFLRIIRPIFKDYVHFIWIVFTSKYYRDHIRSLSKGTNINNVKEEYITDMLIPLPPLSEQKRIVAKVEELFGVMG